jgi:N-formylglutamate amidohydrolase
VVDACRDAPGVSSVVNGRFKGGYITRHYGQPGQAHVHAVQLEKCQSLYMQEVAPFAYDEARRRGHPAGAAVRWWRGAGRGPGAVCR